VAAMICWMQMNAELSQSPSPKPLRLLTHLNFEALPQLLLIRVNGRLTEYGHCQFQGMKGIALCVATACCQLLEEQWHGMWGEKRVGDQARPERTLEVFCSDSIRVIRWGLEGDWEVAICDVEKVLWV
jgi:hypothetical protein